MKATIRRIVSLCLALLFVMGICAIGGGNLKASATTKTADEAINWVKSKLGQGLDYDGQYGYQCVDLIFCYYEYLGVPVSWGNGADFTWNTLPSGWQRLQGAQPQKGDILVYTGGEGHVAIYESDYSTYHQNFDGCSYVVRATYRYNAINNPYWGVIRPNWNEHVCNYTIVIKTAPTRTTTGTRVAYCSCGKSETTTIPAIPYTTDLEEGVYTIPSKCKAGTSIASTCGNNGSLNAYLWEGTSGDLQWFLHKNTDGTYFIENDAYRGYYLTIEDNSMLVGGNLITYQYTGESNQRFYIIPDGEYYRLVVKRSYLTLDLHNNETQNGSNITQWRDNGGNNQRWMLKLGNPTMSLSSTSVNVSAGSTKTVNCTITRASDYLLTTSISNEAVCSVSWGNWTGWTRPLNITGKAGGTAVITITFKDKNSGVVYSTKTITVTVPDNDKPTASITSSNNVAVSQTATLTMSDTGGLAGYYWGTNASYLGNTYTAITGTNKTMTKTVSEPGTYYLTAKDSAGNVSSTVSKTFYKTSLNANGGSVSPANVLTMSGNSFTLPTPTRSGYSFKNWNTKSDGSGTAYTGTYSPTASLTLYVVWQQNAPTTYTLTYNANGGAGAPASQTGSGNITLSTVRPTRDGYTFLGWAASSTATAAQYQPGASFSLTKNTTLYAVWQKNQTPIDPSAGPVIEIRNYVSTKSVAYRTTVTFTSEVQNAVDGAQVHWFVDGQDKGTGETFTVYDARESYTIQAKYLKDGNVLSESQTEKVSVSTGFFAKLVAFFRSLFGRLPVIAQAIRKEF